jgi:flagellar protein FlaJ
MAQKLLLPFSILPPQVLMGVTPQFLGPGRIVATLYPALYDSLRQAGYDITARDYASLAVVAACANAVIFGAMIMVFGSKLVGPASAVGLGAVGALVILFASLFTMIAYPQIQATRKKRLIDAQLIAALRQLLIELRSGVPLFNSMASLTYDYGEVSDEFKRIVRRINAGTPEIDALTDAASTSPSDNFRKTLWQISNSLKVGSDVSNVIEAQVEELTLGRIDQIRRYGQELSPWTMIYMMAAVILPSLGVTMLIVVISFLGTSIPSIILVFILVGLAGFQIFFLNFVSSRRPTV